jgi:hypothetical protein
METYKNAKGNIVNKKAELCAGCSEPLYSSVTRESNAPPWKTTRAVATKAFTTGRILYTWPPIFLLAHVRSPVKVFCCFFLLLLVHPSQASGHSSDHTALHFLHHAFFYTPLPPLWQIFVPASIYTSALPKKHSDEVTVMHDEVMDACSHIVKLSSSVDHIWVPVIWHSWGHLLAATLLSHELSSGTMVSSYSSDL